MKTGYRKVAICITLALSWTFFSAFAGIAKDTATVLTQVEFSDEEITTDDSSKEEQEENTVSENEAIKEEPELETETEKTEIEEEQPETEAATATEETEEQPETDSEKQIGSVDWKQTALANVENYVNIRKEPGEESEVAGMLYKSGAGQILEQKENWIKIKSGNVEGYVRKDFILSGDAAKEYADTQGNLIATVQTETLFVRENATQESKILDYVGMGDELTVLNIEDGWVQVELDGFNGFLSADYLSVDYTFGEAVSMEEVMAAKKAAEERAEKERGRVEALATQNSSAVSFSTDDVTLLAGMIQCEAGKESQEGMIAVGNVIMNRVASGSYPSTVYGVVTARGQFPPATNGKLSSVLARGVKTECYNAAMAAINGTNYVGGATHFRSTSSGASGTVIGNHVFW